MDSVTYPRRWKHDLLAGNLSQQECNENGSTDALQMLMNVVIGDTPNRGSEPIGPHYLACCGAG
jgi:hypothetical protein